MWSLTRPIACMKAYIVVGPTKLQPLFLRSFDIATDSGQVANRSPLTVSRVDRAGRKRDT